MGVQGTVKEIHYISAITDQEEKISHFKKVPVRTGLSRFYQHSVSGAVIVGGNNPHAELFSTWHTGDFTSIVWGGAVVGFSVVPFSIDIV